MDKTNMRHCIELGKTYLISKIDDGLCQEFHQLKHGPSQAWTTACVGSSLYEFDYVSKDMIDVLLSQQHENGGWSYNPSVSTDADSTLRAIQFLRKIDFKDKKVIERAEDFVVSHQLEDGGITTYLPEEAKSTGYLWYEKGWCSSHPCVTALAINQLRDIDAIQKAKVYLQKRLENHNSIAYWWNTPFYVLYETGHQNGYDVSSDPVEISLALLLESKHGVYNPELTQKLLPLQREDGSFLPSRQFHIPHPYQTVNDIVGDEKVIEDKQGIFSTCSAIVAISRQMKLKSF